MWRQNLLQVVQNNRSGEISVVETPAPTPQAGHVLVQNAISLVSAGTERAGVNFARKSLLGKARSRPDLVRQVVAKARRDGLLNTWQMVRERLDASQPLGYSCTGTVVELGEGVNDISPGDRVACVGSGYASHAEFVSVPRNLVAKLTENVTFDDAGFGTLGAIALQGIRRAELTAGETAGVIGLGLLGQLTVMILKAYGHPVFGVDISQSRVDTAKARGMDGGGVVERDDIESLASAFTGGHGLDAVVVTAATADSEPIRMAGEIARERGRVSVVGDVGMDVDRRTYYLKELDLRVSRSYGPGRYDPTYEEHGVDYPRSYVRWTEQRNLEEFLRLAGAGLIQPGGLITHRFGIPDAIDAYKLVVDNPAAEDFLGVVIEYGGSHSSPKHSVAASRRPSGKVPSGKARIGLVGAGSFMSGTIVPAIRQLDNTVISWVVSASGLSATDLARKADAQRTGSDYEELINSDEVDAVVSATRHNLSSKIVIAALRANKPVHVEKPLALSVDDLRAVAEAARESTAFVNVGFNRRFAPLVEALSGHFADGGTPLAMTYRINAGWIEPSHWVHDPVEGGGRVLGEVCHFVDLMQHVCSAPPTQVFAIGLKPDRQTVLGDDNVQALIRFADGSTGSILYSALGAPSQPKESLEVLGGGRSARLDDFRRLVLYGSSATTKKNRGGDKGHRRQFQLFAEAARGAVEPPIPLRELISATLATLAIPKSIATGLPVEIDVDEIALSVAGERERE